MGQGQSQSDKNVSSNYATTSNGTKAKKSKRKLSHKSAGTPQSSSSGSSLSKSQSETPGGRKPSQTTVQSSTSSYVTPSSTGMRNGSAPSATSSSTSTPSTSSVAHRGSSNTCPGGERSVPSRQFSLTRQTSAQATQNKHAHIEKYFNKYKDKDEDAILAEGMEKFCVDLGVDPTEFIVLVLAWKFEASQMCRFTREEFINGCQKMQAHNAKSLKERFPDLLAEAKSKKNFKDLYNFTFSFGLDHSTGQRSLPIDMAKPLWDLVFTQNRPDILERWFEFLKDNEVRGVSRDTWNMFLPFVETTLPDLSNYDESEAWPSLFDDFVEGEQERTTL